MMEQIGFGRDVTSRLETALQREWLVTNGIGGYASSTIALANTRRFHGMLVAALQYPLRRTLLVSKLEATARLGGDLFYLTTNEYGDGTINPRGYHNLESFLLEGMIPVFTWAIADNLLEQRVWMDHGHNTTYVTYSLVRASRPIALEIVPLCSYREAGGTTEVRGWMPDVHAEKEGLRVDAFTEAVPYWLRSNSGTFVPGVVRHLSLRHRAESYRGLEDREDLFAVGRLDAKLSEGETLALVLTCGRDFGVDWLTSYEAEKARQSGLLAKSGLEDEPGWVRQLVLAADQFIVDGPIEVVGTARDAVNDEAQGKCIIAGYPWLGDRGRDSMIALPGLTLAAGRPEIASSILRTFSSYLDQRMLPSAFPAGAKRRESPEFTTADASLWLCWALYRYLECTDDRSLVQDLYATLVEVIEWVIEGTNDGLVMDENDNLLSIGAAPIGPTRMNARDSDWVVSPRVGKPVEINALWHNALATMAHLAGRLEQTEETARWAALAARVAECFEARYWYEGGNHLYDVIDGPDGDDTTLRPNQILAVSLPFGAIKDEDMARAVVDTVARHLQTSYGLRTLSPRDPAYVQRYAGSPSARARAYQQGTAWAWLIGPFAIAHQKVYSHPAKARSFLRPFADQLATHGIGTIGEIFDGDPPHTPRGCIASASSVAQVLFAWLACGHQAGS